MSLLSGILFVMLGLGADGAPALVQSRTPPPAMMGLMHIPASLGGYSYLIMKLGPLQFTRKGLSVASTAACLTFTVSCFFSFLGSNLSSNNINQIGLVLCNAWIFFFYSGITVSKKMKGILMVLVIFKILIVNQNKHLFCSDN